MKRRIILLTVPAAALSVAGFTAAQAAVPMTTHDSGAGRTGDERVYDPSTLTPVPNGGGLIAPDGTNVCAEDPGNVVGPDGTYLCFTGVVAGPGGTGAGTPEYQEPQVGGTNTGVNVDTGVPAEWSTPVGEFALTGTALAAATGAGWIVVRRRSASGS